MQILPSVIYWLRGRWAPVESLFQFAAYGGICCKRKRFDRLCNLIAVSSHWKMFSIPMARFSKVPITQPRYQGPLLPLSRSRRREAKDPGNEVADNSTGPELYSYVVCIKCFCSSLLLQFHDKLHY